MTDEAWFVYIVKCADGKLYTGVSNDVKKRVAAHNSGKGCKFTSCRYPVKLLFWERCGARSDALKREANVKKLSRSKKLELVALCKN
jgi:putative endonuclease